MAANVGLSNEDGGFLRALSLLYSPKCLKEEFSEVFGNKEARSLGGAARRPD